MAETKLFDSDALFRWKHALFSALQHLIDYNVVGRYMCALLILMETMQLLYFAFLIPQDHETGYDYFLYSFDFFVYVPYIQANTNSGAFFYTWLVHALFLLVVVMVTVVLLVKYHDTTYRPSFMGRIFIQTASMLMALFRSVLAIPSIIVFTMPFICTSSTMTCWSGMGVITSILSLFAVLIYVVLLLTYELVNDSYINSALPWAAPDSKLGIIGQLFKILLAFYVAADTNLDICRYFYAIIVIYSGYITYCEYVGLRWYDQLTNGLRGFETCVTSWCCFEMYALNLLGTTIQLDVAVITIVIGIFLSSIFVVRQNMRIRVGVQNDITILNDENMAINCIGLVAHLPSKAQSDPEALWVLMGMLNIHREHCKSSDCICATIADSGKEGQQVRSRVSAKALIASTRRTSLKGPTLTRRSSALEKIRMAAKAIEQRVHGNTNIFTIMAKDGEKRSEKVVVYSSPQMQWKTFLGLILDEVIAKFSKSVNLRLMMSYYQNMMEKNYYKAYFQLVKAGEKDCSYGQQFAIYRMKVILDKAIYAEETAKNGGVIEIDLSQFRDFEGHRRQFDRIVRECTEKVIEFWNMLLSVNLKIDAMYVLGGKISTALKEVYFTFNEIIRIFPDHLQTYIGYAQFLKQVANNEIEAGEYLERANQIRRTIDVGRRQVHNDASNFSINRDTGILIASGNLDTLGIIQNFNEHTQVMFGYSYNDLIGLPITKLMPKVLATAHDKFMTAFAETGKTSIINQETVVPAKSKNGLLFQVALLVKTMPGLGQGLYYISFMKKDPGINRKGVAKLPYQCQKRGKICFILTDLDGSIIGISETTARTLGIPTDYFEKSKYLFRETVNIKKLNRKLTRPENEEELKRGLVLTMKTRLIYETIDKDFLTTEEMQSLDRRRPNIEVFMHLEINEFRYGAKYRIYSFVPVKAKKSSGALLHIPGVGEENKRKDTPTASEDESSDVGPAKDAQESEASTVAQGDKTRALVKELKKNIFEHKESRQIVFFKRLLYLSFPILFTLTVLDLTYNLVALKHVRDSIKLDESAQLRRSLVATMTMQFQSYVNLALGQQANVSEYESNRELSLRNDLLLLITRIQENEYDFQGYMRPVDISKLTEISSKPGVLMDEVYSDGSVKSSTRGLISTVLTLTTRLNRIVNMLPISSLNTTFMQGVYNKTTKSTTALDQNVKDAYFVLRNGLYNILNASTIMINSIVGFHSDALNEHSRRAVIFHALCWSILGLMILVALPIMNNVQIGKRAIIRFFAEVPKKKIEEILKRCGEFYAELLGKFAQPVGKPTVNSSPTKRAQLDGSQGQLPSPDSSPPSRVKVRLNARNKEDGDEERVHEEDVFQKERKKRLLEYKAGIGNMFALYLAIMFLLAGYVAVMHYLQLQEKQALLDNYDFVTKVQNRWFHVTAMTAYVIATTSTYRIVDYSSKRNCSDMYFSLALDSENLTDLMNTDHPSNQADIVDTLSDLRTDFCDTTFSNGYVNTTRCTLDFCEHVLSNMTSGGMKVMVYYMLTEYRTRYFNVTYNVTLPLAGADALNRRLVFDYLIGPTLEHLAARAKDLHYNLINSDTAYIILMMAGLLLLEIGAFAVLVVVFAQKLNDELWNAKGIVPLLPFDIIEKNPALKELFSKQMNIII